MIFGIASTNCKYILALKDELKVRGNFVKVLFFNRKKAINCLMQVVINKEVDKRKAAGTNATALGTKPGAMAFVNQWKIDNVEFIVEYFRMEDNNWCFVQGILFATYRVSFKLTQPISRTVLVIGICNTIWK